MTTDEAPALRRHAIYGVVLESDFPFTHRLAAADGPAELRFTHRPGRAAGWDDASPAWSSAVPGPDGAPDCVLLRRPGGEELLRFGGIADFRLAGDRIDAWLPDAGQAWLAELRFLGPVLAYWLERRGLVALHAASVALPGRAGGPRAIGLLSSHGGGKSLLAAALMERAGAALLADDVSVIERAGEPAGADGFLARPANPQMRLPPVDAERLTGRADLPRVHPGYAKRRVPVGGADGFGRFAERPLPLAALYVPDRRRGGEIEIERLPPAEALLALVGHSFVARLAAGAGLQPARIAVLGALAETVPAFRLSYPDGRRHLAAVAERLAAATSGAGSVLREVAADRVPDAGGGVGGTREGEAADRDLLDEAGQ